jgi:PKD repeat protein
LLATTPDECVAISNLPIQVNPRVQANIVADKTSGCSPLEINFNNFSRGQNSDEGSWYKKRVGTETTELISSENITMLHIFNNLSGVDEQYEVIYIARSTAGCTDTASVVITVFADLVPQFEVTPPYQLLPNRTVTITNNTAPGNWDFYWEFGDGTTSTQRDPGTHIYPNYGRYDIILSVTGNNCTARQTETIVIGAITPIVDFEYDPERVAGL